MKVRRKLHRGICGEVVERTSVDGRPTVLVSFGFYEPEDQFTFTKDTGGTYRLQTLPKFEGTRLDGVYRKRIAKHNALSVDDPDSPDGIGSITLELEGKLVDTP